MLNKKGLIVMTTIDFKATLTNAKVLAGKLRRAKAPQLIHNVQSYLLDNSVSVSQPAVAMFLLGAGIELEPTEMLRLLDIVDMDNPPEWQDNDARLPSSNLLEELENQTDDI
jgi:hypothetical protein